MVFDHHCYRRMNRIHVLLFVLTFIKIGYMGPSVTLTSCKSNAATITITDIADDLIVYFRTDTAYNMITSSGGTIVHACGFDECNIEWNVKFYIVIQRNLLYQTSNDTVVWLVCTSDSNSINAINMEFSAFQIVENLTTKVYRPEVSMSFYNGGTQLVSEGEVQLGDVIEMVIRVTNNANDYFDISAKSCFASGITLIEDRCPIDEDLFGQFNTTAVGYLSNTFGMFRPTSISGGPFESACTDAGTSRRKRKVDTIRPADGQSNPSVVRGFTLTAVAEGEETKVKRKNPKLDICVAIPFIAAGVSIFIIIVGIGVAVFAISIHYYRNFTISIVSLKDRKDGNETHTTENEMDNPQENLTTSKENICTDDETVTQNQSCNKQDIVTESDKHNFDKHIKELEKRLQIPEAHGNPHRRTSVSNTAKT